MNLACCKTLKPFQIQVFIKSETKETPNQPLAPAMKTKQKKYKKPTLIKPNKLHNWAKKTHKPCFIHSDNWKKQHRIQHDNTNHNKRTDS